MGYSGGTMLLIDKNWAYRTDPLQRAFRELTRGYGLRLHDHNRKGEKGFFRIGEGFTTTPEGAAMRMYFKSHGQPEMARLFKDSSMEFVRSLGGDPLCVVTELPLFIVEGPVRPEHPDAYLAFRAQVAEIRLQLSKGNSAQALWAPFGLNPLPVTTAVEMQLSTIAAAMDAV